MGKKAADDEQVANAAHASLLPPCNRNEIGRKFYCHKCDSRTARQDWAARISARWQDSVEAIIDTGRLLADALDEIRQARQSNEASETVVPTTFVDDAELVWHLTEKFTQEQAAKAMGWSRPLVAQYAQLKKIDADAWAVVVTSFAELVTASDDEAVTDGVTTVTKSPFTERLLREILDLSADQQKRLCEMLAKGKDKKGHGFGKADFKTKSVWFRALNTLLAAAKERLESKIPAEAVGDYFASISGELHAKEEYADECVALKAPGSKFERLLQSAIDDWEKKNNTRVIVKDIRLLSSDDLQDGSIDCIITDPPYPKEYVELFGDLGALVILMLAALALAGWHWREVIVSALAL